MKKTLIFALLFVSLISCSKNGAPGAVGATGAVGPVGPVGPSGPDSVLYSNWIVLSMTQNPNSGDTRYRDTINDPNITQEILDRGLMVSYIDDTVAGTILNASEYLNSSFSAGHIYLQSDFDWSTFRYRYVMIPGTINTGNSLTPGFVNGYTSQQLEEMDYNDIKKLFGIDGSRTVN